MSESDRMSTILQTYRESLTRVGRSKSKSALIELGSIRQSLLSLSKNTTLLKQQHKHDLSNLIGLSEKIEKRKKRGSKIHRAILLFLALLALLSFVILLFNPVPGLSLFDYSASLSSMISFVLAIALVFVAVFGEC